MIRERLRTYKLKKHLSPIFELVGIPGTVNVTTQKDENGEFYVVKVSSEHEFTAFYPKGYSNRLLTITLIDISKELPSGISVPYTESLVLKDYVPYKFVIHRYPETQVTYLMDDTFNSKGDITYKNSCQHGGFFTVLEKPVFTSEMVNLSRILDA